ncbi:MAG: hypothetical protein ACON4I_05525 [Candidatus Puniceispirillaceae bacterium]
MIEVNLTDGASGEAEILQLLTAYLSDRLFTPRQRKTMQVFVDLTRAAVRVPVTRAMLMPRRSGLRTIAPASFEMTVSTAAGIRDAGEVLAHEMIHISQVMNGRLVLGRATKKVNGSKTTVDQARWMGGKPVIIDQLEWRHRPWEIEACHWQTILVDEFLKLAGGNHAVLQLQKAGKKHLALFEAALPVPQVARPHPEPHLDMIDAPAALSSGADVGATEPAGHVAAGLASSSSNGTSRIADNAASIDSLLNMPMPPAKAALDHQAHQTTTQSAADETDDHAISAAALEAVFGVVEPQAEDSPADMAPAAPHSAAPDLDLNGPDLNGTELNGAHINGPCLNGASANGSGTNGHHPDTAILAPDDVMQIIVPGLESPRPLHADSLVAKRQDLQQRGLLNG